MRAGWSTARSRSARGTRSNRDKPHEVAGRRLRRCTRQYAGRPHSYFRCRSHLDRHRPNLARFPPTRMDLGEATTWATDSRPGSLDDEPARHAPSNSNLRARHGDCASRPWRSVALIRMDLRYRGNRVATHLPYNRCSSRNGVGRSLENAPRTDPAFVVPAVALVALLTTESPDADAAGRRCVDEVRFTHVQTDVGDHTSAVRE